MARSQFRNSYRLFYANRKISELFLEVRVYRGSDICSDHFLILAELVLTPKWLHLTKTLHEKKNIRLYKIKLLNDESTR